MGLSLVMIKTETAISNGLGKHLRYFFDFSERFVESCSWKFSFFIQRSNSRNNEIIFHFDSVISAAIPRKCYWWARKEQKLPSCETNTEMKNGVKRGLSDHSLRSPLRLNEEIIQGKSATDLFETDVGTGGACFGARYLLLQNFTSLLQPSYFLVRRH